MINNIYEIKVCNELKTEHFIQTALYCYLHEKYNYYLFNVLSSELIEIKLNNSSLEKLLDILIENQNILNEEKFLLENKITI